MVPTEEAPERPATVGDLARAAAALELTKEAEVPPPFMSPDYDWVEQETQTRWRPNASVVKVVTDALARLSLDANEDRMMNVVRRAAYAHRNRPALKVTAGGQDATAVWNADTQAYEVSAGGTRVGAGATVEMAIADFLRSK